MNKKLVPVNIERKGILTKQQKIHLNSMQIDPKILNNIHRSIEKKFKGLIEDLTIIKNSKYMRGWNATRYGLITETHQTLQGLIHKNQPIYTDIVRITRSIKERKKNIRRSIKEKNNDVKTYRTYWLERPENLGTPNDRIFEPSFALRRIKHYLNQQTFEILCWAVENNLIPNNKQSAIDEKDFIKAKSDIHFFELLKQNGEGIKNHRIELKPDLEKAILENKKMWDYIHKQFNMLNKKLYAKYGITAVPKIQKSGFIKT